MYWFKRYKKEISEEVIPLYEVQGNEIFAKDFDDDTEKLYQYCVEHHVTWQTVLRFKEDPNVLY